MLAETRGEIGGGGEFTMIPHQQAAPVETAMQRAWLRHAIRPAQVSSAEVSGAGRPAAKAWPISARRAAACGA